MGRYTTVQAYTDNSSSMRAVSYDQAAASASAASASGVVRPEKVVNPYGSTAGAGSGEFHVYRHARARETARLQELDDASEEREANDAFRTQIDLYRKEEEERTEKRRRKRRREKEARMRKKNMKLAGIAVGDGEVVVDEDEFEYVPAAKRGGITHEVGKDVETERSQEKAGGSSNTEGTSALKSDGI